MQYCRDQDASRSDGGDCSEMSSSPERAHASTPYRRNLGRAPPTGVKKSMSFLTGKDLISFRAIPILGAAAYLGSSLGAVAMEETFVQ